MRKSAHKLHKVFLSYHHGDADEAAAFVDTFSSAFSSALSVGVSDGDRLAPTGDESAFLDRISQKYIGDSRLTIVLVGSTTWSRRFVDWEIAATLAYPERSIMAVLLPSARVPERLPPRIEALPVRPYPTSTGELCRWIAQAVRDGRPTPPQLPLMRRDEPFAG